VFLREQKIFDDERARLLMWGSMLKDWTAFEQQKAVATRKQLNVMEIQLDRRQAVTDHLDAQARKLLDDAKELYAAVKARANATIKQEVDLAACTLVVSEQERAMAKQEQGLWDKDEVFNRRLDRELEGIASHETDLDSHEATLAGEHESLEMTRSEVLAHDLAADIKDERLNSWAMELMDREK
jgi:hypothetical protein